MKLVQGYHLPDREDQIDQVLRESIRLGRPAYQHEKLEAALEYCGQRRGALDIGGHIGMWSMQLALAGFETIDAFEPDPEKHMCFLNNVTAHLTPEQYSAIVLHEFGLSDKKGRASLIQKTGTSLKTHVRVGEGEIELYPLDDMPPDLPNPIDFIKIDVEGFELFVVKGGERLITANMPVMVVEQKKAVATRRYGVGDKDAITLLEHWGYRVAAEFNGDFVMVPE